MALDTRAKNTSKVGTLWGSTIGKKAAMAVTGIIMVAYLVAHMAGNLKIFSGPDDFNDYSHFLRTIGEPMVPYGGVLWILRIILLVSVVVHIVAAVQLSRRGIRGRAWRKGSRSRGDYLTFTMRSGGVVLGLFVVWHLLDLTLLVVNTSAKSGHPYENVVATFSSWYGNAIYLAALLALGFHLRHGIWSAVQTLGAGTESRDRALKVIANSVAIVITVGFMAVPISVMTGVVSLYAK